MPSDALARLMGRGAAKSARPVRETKKRDVVADTKAELTELQRGIRDRAAKEEKRKQKATDSEYWLAICFQSREQKEEFLRNAGLMALGDKYLDGQKVAKKLGVAVAPDTDGYGRIKDPDPAWLRLTKGATK